MQFSFAFLSAWLVCFAAVQATPGVVGGAGRLVTTTVTRVVTVRDNRARQYTGMGDCPAATAAATAEGFDRRRANKRNPYKRSASSTLQSLTSSTMNEGPTRTGPYNRPRNTRPPHERPNNTRPHERPNNTRPHERPNNTRPHERPNNTRPHERPNNTEPFKRFAKKSKNAMQPTSKPYNQPGSSSGYGLQPTSKSYNQPGSTSSNGLQPTSKSYNQPGSTSSNGLQPTSKPYNQPGTSSRPAYDDVEPTTTQATPARKRFRPRQQNAASNLRGGLGQDSNFISEIAMNGGASTELAPDATGVSKREPVVFDMTEFDKDE